MLAADPTVNRPVSMETVKLDIGTLCAVAKEEPTVIDVRQALGRIVSANDCTPTSVARMDIVQKNAKLDLQKIRLQIAVCVLSFPSYGWQKLIEKMDTQVEDIRKRAAHLKAMEQILQRKKDSAIDEKNRRAARARELQAAKQAEQRAAMERRFRALSLDENVVLSTAHPSAHPSAASSEAPRARTAMDVS